MRRRIRRHPSSRRGLFRAVAEAADPGSPSLSLPPCYIFLDSTVVLVLGLAMAVQVEVQVAVLVPVSGGGR
jgi:hypothetical protein